MKSEQDYNTSFAIGVLLLENKGLVFGKTLEIDGWYASGKLRIPLGRYIMIFIKLIYYFKLDQFESWIIVKISHLLSC